jgi:hypothetical protein
MAVSMALNYAGNPIGSALTGPLLHFGLGFALLISVLFTFAAAGLALITIPRGSRRSVKAAAPT